MQTPERRWMRWGFAAEDVQPFPPAGNGAEWKVEEPTEKVLSAYPEDSQPPGGSSDARYQRWYERHDDPK